MVAAALADLRLLRRQGRPWPAHHPGLDLSNTFAPAWNESITPGSRFSASLLSSQSNPWSIRVTDEDQPGADAVCSVSPALDAAAFSSGLAAFAAGSCTTLEIGLECVSQ